MILELRNLLSSERACQIVRALASARFHDGKLTASGEARDHKRNLQLDENDEISKSCGAVILAALSGQEIFKTAAMPHTITPMRFCKYDKGMEYGDHLDLPIVSTAKGPLRRDLAITVWLSPRDSYDGGDLVLRSRSGDRVLRGDAGTAVLYPANTVHRVTPVTRGERMVAITWLQSMVPDPRRRELLFELTQGIATVDAGDHTESNLTRLRSVHHELLRMWVTC